MIVTRVGQDALKRVQWMCEFPDYPKVVYGGSEDLVLRESYHWVFDKPVSFYAADSFIGLDRGDIGEFDIYAYVNAGFPIYKRSLHMQQAMPYNAYEVQYYSGKGQRLAIDLVARVTATNNLLDDQSIRLYRNNNRLSARPHFALYLYSWDKYE